MTDAVKVQGKTHVVEINAQEYVVEASAVTLAQIRQLGGIPADEKVYHEIPQPESDPEVTDTATVPLHKLEKFYSVRPASGGEA